MRKYGPVFVTLLVIASAHGQDDNSSRWAKRRRLYPNLVQIFDLAETSPAPIRALALYLIGTSRELSDTVWKRELFEESFESGRASSIPFPVKYVAISENAAREAIPQRAVTAATTDSGIDRLTLQTSAVRALLRLDPEEARGLFDNISVETGPQTCSDGLIPDLTSYYHTAGDVAASFSARDREHQRHTQFIGSMIDRIRSSSELVPATAMLLQTHLSSDDLTLLVIRLASKLESLSGDSRSFFINLADTSDEVMKLADASSPTAALILLKGWRTHLVTNLSGTRCADTIDPNSVYPKWAEGAVATFNTHSSELRAAVGKIETSDVKPGPTDSSVLEDNSTDSSQDPDLQKQWKKLLFWNGSTKFDQDVNEHREDAFDAFLSAIQNMEPNPAESSIAFVRRKSLLMNEAVMVAASHEERLRALDDAISLLKLSVIQPEEVPDWYVQVQTLCDVSAAVFGGDEVLKALEQSGNAPLVLVAKLRRLRNH